tara:strand:+ start:400 stop:645 length:246 start_codon:yes stop_codon:yes gene_type:complete
MYGNELSSEVKTSENRTRNMLLEASEAHFKAHIKKHQANIEVLLRHTVGLAEHPDIMETIEKELEIMAEYDDKLEMLKKYF